MHDTTWCWYNKNIRERFFSRQRPHYVLNWEITFRTLPVRGGIPATNHLSHRLRKLKYRSASTPMTLSNRGPRNAWSQQG